MYTSVIDGYSQRMGLQQQVMQPQIPIVTQQPAIPLVMPGRPSVNKRQKFVEVIVEKAVPITRYVDVEEEIIRQVPVENRIE